MKPMRMRPVTATRNFRPMEEQNNLRVRLITDREAAGLMDAEGLRAISELRPTPGSSKDSGRRHQQRAPFIREPYPAEKQSCDRSPCTGSGNPKRQIPKNRKLRKDQAGSKFDPLEFGVCDLLENHLASGLSSENFPLAAGAITRRRNRATRTSSPSTRASAGPTSGAAAWSAT